MKHTLLNTLAATAGILMFIGLVSRPVSAYEPLLEVGVGLAIYEENIDPDDDYMWTVRGGVKESPLYLVGTLEEGRGLRILGQEVGSSDFTSFGVGATYQLHDKVNIYTEVAYVDVSTTSYAPATAEVAYTYLVGRHAVGDRKIPLEPGCAYTSDTQSGCYTSAYELDDSAYSITIGAGWQVHKHVKVTVAYRFMQVDSYMNIKDNTREREGWWEESDQVDFGMTTVNILYTY